MSQKWVWKWAKNDPRMATVNNPIVCTHVASEADHLQLLVALAAVGVGVGMVAVGGNRVVELVEVGGRGHCCWWWSLQRIRHQSRVWKNKKNGKWRWKWIEWPFLQKQGKGSIFQQWSFFSSFSTHSEVHFWKMEEKWKLKMSQKWPENGYCEQP